MRSLVGACVYVALQEFCEGVEQVEEASSSIRNEAAVRAGRRRRLLSEMDAPLSSDINACTVEDVLQLLQLLYAISRDTMAQQNNILNE